jgi:hypothetical protein
VPEAFKWEIVEEGVLRVGLQITGGKIERRCVFLGEIGGEIMGNEVRIRV